MPIIILILLLSAFFRLGFINEIVFKGDEDNTAYEFYDFVKSRSLPIVTKGKEAIYTIHILDRVPRYVTMLFIKDPRIITILTIGLPNTLAVFCCFLFCNKFFNKRTAICATALFGFSGWNILYSRNLWAVNLLPFHGMLLFLFLQYYLETHKIRFAVLAGLMLILIHGSHPTSLSIVISVFLIFLFYIKKKALLFTPLLIIFFVFINRSINVLAMNFSLKGFIYSLKLAIRDDWYYNHLNMSPEYSLAESFSNVFIRIMFLLGVLYLIKRIFQDKKPSPFITIAAWFFGFIIPFGFTGLRTHAHYFIIIFPTLFIISAIGLDKLLTYISEKEKISDWEVLLLSACLVFWNPYIILLIILLGIINFLKYKSLLKYTLYACMTFTLIFQGLTTLQLYNTILKIGGVPGLPGLDLGSKIKTVKFILADARKRYRETGLKSFYSITNDEGYGYLFEYLLPKKADYLSNKELHNGFRYEIINDIGREVEPEETRDYINHTRIGPKLVIIEKINEE